MCREDQELADSIACTLEAGMRMCISCLGATRDRFAMLLFCLNNDKFFTVFIEHARLRDYLVQPAQVGSKDWACQCEFLRKASELLPHTDAYTLALLFVYWFGALLDPGAQIVRLFLRDYVKCDSQNPGVPL